MCFYGPMAIMGAVILRVWSQIYQKAYDLDLVPWKAVRIEHPASEVVREHMQATGRLLFGEMPSCRLQARINEEVETRPIQAALVAPAARLPTDEARHHEKMRLLFGMLAGKSATRVIRPCLGLRAPGTIPSEHSPSASKGRTRRSSPEKAANWSRANHSG